MENRTDHCIRVFFTTYGNYRKPALYSSGFQKSLFRATKKLFSLHEMAHNTLRKSLFCTAKQTVPQCKKIHTTSQGKTNRNLSTI